MLTLPRSLKPLTHRAVAGALGAAGLLGALGLGLPATASASHSQIAMIQDDGQLQANPSQTLGEMRALGATTVRVVLFWNLIAPHATATHQPKFNAADSSSYPRNTWNTYDAIVRDAKADGMTIDFTVAGGAPRWAEGPGIPRNYITAGRAGENFAWKPNANDYGQFMHAVAQRYDGHFTPSGQTSPLPRVHFWTIWNEPNFGEDLGPQATDTSRISYAPMLYRNLVRTGYRALQQTGHGHDTILIGEYAAHGNALSMGRHGRTWPQGLPGYSAQTQPIPFTRTLYCLGQNGAKLTGTAARQVGCPTTAGGRAAFRRDNPGLFDTTGVGDHPYANNATPRSDGKGANPNWATLPNLPKLEAVFDRATHAYGSGKHFAIYSDEYGYTTDPPQQNKSQSVPVKTAAKYINWAEYITYNEPRVASYDQYLLEDGSPNSITQNGGFATGLYTSKGKPKATLNAYRMPLWLPSTTLRHPGPDKVWGEARPAYWGGKDTRQTQTVQVQFQAHGKGAWTTIRTVRSSRYFTVRPTFRTSGNVRLRYTYPSAAAEPLLPLGLGGTSIVSRTQSIVVH